jgi:KaiC/GvpD/RAD55 family RecA-like ATPase
MRSAPLILIFIILVPLLGVVNANAQTPTPHYIVLYAHSYGHLAILNALPNWTGQKAADISNHLTFKLSPALGEDLRIYGGITITVYLRASGTFFGTIGVQLLELKTDGTESPVPSSGVDTGPLRLSTITQLVTLGAGIVDYTFQRGSSILLRVDVDQTTSSGTPLLVWDDPTSPTALRLPAISPISAQLNFSGPLSFGKIFEANESRVIQINATTTDAIGAYRLTHAMFRLTAPNGSIMTFPANRSNATDYTSSYTLTPRLGQGQWLISLILKDLTGDAYSFDETVMVTPFYLVSINVGDSEGVTLQNAIVTIDSGNGATWSGQTNETGWAVLSLPSSQIVGPLNMTINWSGTKTLSTLEVLDASTVHIRLSVYDVGIRVQINGLPIPAAYVTLLQAAKVGQQFTNANGVAGFKSIPAGNYTVRIDYLLATYQYPLNVKSAGVTQIEVPLPHRTMLILLALVIVSVMSTALVRRRHSKVYPRDFSYFNKLTHGGLPDACFAVIVGDSGSGKSVLLNSLAAKHLASGKSIYVTNTEYPNKIRDNMVTLGLCTQDNVTPDKLVFVDAYSAIGGHSSDEEFSVSSHTDLTSLGLTISRSLQAAGPGTDVYLDSLNALVTVLRMDYLINFLQSVAAKVKANNGKFCVTVGTGLEKEDRSKLEEYSDCVIETQLQESSGGQRRRLRIKKLRDKPYVDKWTRFRVEQGKGIIFLTLSKP